MNNRVMLFAFCLAAMHAGANPITDFIENESLKWVNKVDGNVATGKLDNSSINATAIADGDNSYAVAGGVISHNSNKGIKNGKKRAEVKLEGARINAHAEASNGNKAFAGAYVNK
ncbi:hypothetical protein [Neisseria canis]|uniref:Uncharacterized protein n=1 Tax=Neisseria canis TaxID=493 RepID=A0A1X3CRE8_9NEIS|nr:hypothetical protein [Neisseria canis]OSI10146.1 hypothetical protein BWD07_10985 [Neisseria canis]VEF01106.1 Uncharacterised protein [Neisseria canis]